MAFAIGCGADAPAPNKGAPAGGMDPKMMEMMKTATPPGDAAKADGEAKTEEAKTDDAKGEEKKEEPKGDDAKGEEKKEESKTEEKKEDK